MWTEALPGEEEIEARRSALIQFSCDIKIPRRFVLLEKAVLTQS